MDVDELLGELRDEVAGEQVGGSYAARVLIDTGLQIAATIIERKRIDLLCEGILNDGVEKD